jgi:hypothetical protein
LGKKVQMNSIETQVTLAEGPLPIQAEVPLNKGGKGRGPWGLSLEIRDPQAMTTPEVSTKPLSPLLRGTLSLAAPQLCPRAKVRWRYSPKSVTST